MRKEYAIKGIVERFISVPLGKGSITIHFEGGAIDSSLRRDATFSTTNPVEQAIVERLPEFKKGVIKLVCTIGEPKPVEKEEAPEAKVKTLQQARLFLMDMGVPMEELQSKAKVLEAAKEKGITFPNL